MIKRALRLWRVDIHARGNPKHLAFTALADAILQKNMFCALLSSA